MTSSSASGSRPTRGGTPKTRPSTQSSHGTSNQTARSASSSSSTSSSTRTSASEKNTRARAPVPLPNPAPRQLPARDDVLSLDSSHSSLPSAPGDDDVDDGDEPKIPLTVGTVTGGSFSVHVRPSWTIRQVKRHIAVTQSLPHADTPGAALIVGGARLADASLVRDCPRLVLHAGAARVDLVLPLTGGHGPIAASLAVRTTRAPASRSPPWMDDVRPSSTGPSVVLLLCRQDDELYLLELVMDQGRCIDARAQYLGADVPMDDMVALMHGRAASRMRESESTACGDTDADLTGSSSSLTSSTSWTETAAIAARLAGLLGPAGLRPMHNSDTAESDAQTDDASKTASDVPSKWSVAVGPDDSLHGGSSTSSLLPSSTHSLSTSASWPSADDDDPTGPIEFPAEVDVSPSRPDTATSLVTLPDELMREFGLVEDDNPPSALSGLSSASSSSSSWRAFVRQMLLDASAAPPGRAARPATALTLMRAKNAAGIRPPSAGAAAVRRVQSAPVARGAEVGESVAEVRDMGKCETSAIAVVAPRKPDDDPVLEFASEPLTVSRGMVAGGIPRNSASPGPVLRATTPSGPSTMAFFAPGALPTRAALPSRQVPGPPKRTSVVKTVAGTAASGSRPAPSRSTPLVTADPPPKPGDARRAGPSKPAAAATSMSNADSKRRPADPVSLQADLRATDSARKSATPLIKRASGATLSSSSLRSRTAAMAVPAPPPRAKRTTSSSSSSSSSSLSAKSKLQGPKRTPPTTATPAPPTTAPSKPAPRQRTPDRYCAHASCGVRLRLAGTFRCKCGAVHCAAHRLATAHACVFDYKTADRAKLARENPAVTSRAAMGRVPGMP